MRNYKVILVNLNSLPNLGFSPVFPVGANYVCSLLSEMGAEVDFIDFVQRPDLLETLDFWKKSSTASHSPSETWIPWSWTVNIW